MRPLPSLESLRCFEAAARTLHFRSAAKSVALTPTAFGQRIKQLEQELETPLFQRTTRSVQLTPAGMKLLPLAERCLLAAQACVQVKDESDSDPAMDITVGTRHELGLSFVVPALDELAKAVPHVQLHLYFGSGADLLLRVRSLDIDCAITSSYLADARLDAVRLHREDYAFVGSPSLLKAHPLSRAEHARAHVLFDTTPDLPLYRYFRDAPNAPTLRFRRIVRLGTIQAIRARVLAGAGVAVLPKYLVRSDIQSKRLAVLFDKITLNHDYFRLVFRVDDLRREVYESLAKRLVERPLR